MLCIFNENYFIHKMLHVLRNCFLKRFCVPNSIKKDIPGQALNVKGG